jgi:hypothetical protein
VTSVAAGGALLWRGVQIRIVVGAELIATAVVGFAAYKSTRTGSFSQQTDWVTVGVGGLAAAGLLSAIWLLRGRQRVARRRSILVDAANLAFAPAGAAVETDEFGPVASESMTHYHRAGCQLVRNKSVRAASVIEHHRAKRTPCAVCRP